MTGESLAQKIIAMASGKEHVEPGELVWVKVNTLMIHDIAIAGVVEIFKKEFGDNAKIWDRNKVVLIPDHFAYTKDDMANNNIRIMREFAHHQGVEHFYDLSTKMARGVCHIALPECGYTRPGEILVGTDSHTTMAGAFGTFAIGVGNTDAAYILGTGEILLKVPQSIKVIFEGVLPSYLQAKDLILKVIGDLTVGGGAYCSIEFSGPVIENLSAEERMTICNMAAECGAKSGIMVPNKAAINYVKNRTNINFGVILPDTNAVYIKTLVYDVTEMEPVVALPHSPDNLVSISEVPDIKIDRVYLGSCTGGKFDDFMAVANILKGKKVLVETYAVPATREIIEKLINEKIDGESIFGILSNAGVFISLEPCCAACFGGTDDTFGRANKAMNILSTTNRNFLGRMGHKEAKIFLASPYTAAVSALTGHITSPTTFMDKI